MTLQYCNYKLKQVYSGIFCLSIWMTHRFCLELRLYIAFLTERNPNQERQDANDEDSEPVSTPQFLLGVGKSCRQSSSLLTLLPALIELPIEDGSAQGKNGIQALGSPTHAGSFGTSRNDRFASGFGDPASHMHSLCSKRRVAHAMHIRAEVFGLSLSNAARFARFWFLRRQTFTSCDNL